MLRLLGWGREEGSDEFVGWLVSVRVTGEGGGREGV